MSYIISRARQMFTIIRRLPTFIDVCVYFVHTYISPMKMSKLINQIAKSVGRTEQNLQGHKTFVDNMCIDRRVTLSI